MHCEHDCTCCPTNASQSLDEMDFERGIWYVAQHGDIQNVRKHLNRGDVDQRHTGYTALHYAARNGHLDVCKLLIDSGANINAVTNGGVTALSRAASTGHKEIVEYLLGKNADPFIQDSDGKTALHKAAENGHLHICRILLSVAEKLKDIEDKRGNRPNIDVLLLQQFTV
ncbi:unnamed protein product [Acanthoscelides obtectus]|uniref:Ankyrin repeat domain-containing protein 39 n=1 Tax=Acanthoscelides obtectus TaxID=200917 RepID=A0A9P0NRA6_ACAOB|nr:unnamed protein product [Acanthoscelides obtectus]CAK1634598.1 Ankyrin repeat domain-containing protein 39 [Acanthoscelides obtectus]